MENYVPGANINPKKAGVAIIMSVKSKHHSKKITSDRQGNFIIIQMSVHQEYKQPTWMHQK